MQKSQIMVNAVFFFNLHLIRRYLGRFVIAVIQTCTTSDYEDYLRPLLDFYEDILCRILSYF